MNKLLNVSGGATFKVALPSGYSVIKVVNPHPHGRFCNPLRTAKRSLLKD